MSYPNYEAYQGQQPTEDNGASPVGANQAQQTPIAQQPGMGQQPGISPHDDSSAFQGVGQGPPGTGQGGAPQAAGDGKTTLWYDAFSNKYPFNYVNTDRMGELEPWIDENFVRGIWMGMGEQVNVKMIRDKFSG